MFSAAIFLRAFSFQLTPHPSSSGGCGCRRCRASPDLVDGDSVEKRPSSGRTCPTIRTGMAARRQPRRTFWGFPAPWLREQESATWLSLQRRPADRRPDGRYRVRRKGAVTEIKNRTRRSPRTGPLSSAGGAPARELRPALASAREEGVRSPARRTVSVRYRRFQRRRGRRIRRVPAEPPDPPPAWRPAVNYRGPTIIDALSSSL